MDEPINIPAELLSIKAEAKRYKGFVGAMVMMRRVRALRPYQEAQAVAKRQELELATKGRDVQSIEECAWWEKGMPEGMTLEDLVVGAREGIVSEPVAPTEEQDLRQEMEMQNKTPLSKKTQQEVDALTIDAGAMRARAGESQPQFLSGMFLSGMDAINAAQVEMNAQRIEPNPVVAEFLESIQRGDSEPKWVN